MPIIGLLIIISMFSNIAEAEEDTINIVCSNTVLADFTSNIISENVTISYIMPGGACPAHFDTTPSDIQTCVNADIVISLGWEPWLSGLLNSSGNTDYQEIKCLGLGEWSLPSNAIKFVEKIRDGLSDILPEHNSTIQNNANNYLDEINETADFLKNMVDKLGYNNRPVIPMLWQKDFIGSLGFDVINSYAPPEGLSTQDKLNISESAISENACAIIDNLQSGTDFGAQIAKESGASHVIFTNFPGAIDDVDSYLDVLNYNTVELVKGITIYDYTQENSDNIQNTDELVFQRNAALTIALMAFIIALVLVVLYKKK